jgi:3-dehydrosphinganine reductase
MKQDSHHAIITGGSSGIGRAIALQLARQGYCISIVARCQKRLNSTRSAIENARARTGRQVLALSADVSEREQVELAMQEAISRLGPPQLLVTCAGIAHPGYFQEIPIEIFEQTMAINYFGTLYCIRAVLPAMKQQHRGKIGMISSGAGLIGVYGYSAYSPSKFALRGLAEALRAELKSVGIGVSIAYPPDTDTPQLAAENKIKPPATRQITATASPWQADRVARIIIKGLNRGQFEIPIGIEMGILKKLNGLISLPLNKYFDRIVARHTRK